jgi:predicted DNA-binding antitoxin AbrB/MazE fold protein
MATERLVIGGIVKNGVIVPEGDAKLPEGARVEIALSIVDISPELKAELAAWERASDEAWGLIDQWEDEAKT